MVEWHHRLDGHEFEYTPGVDDELPWEIIKCNNIFKSYKMNVHYVQKT